jgi:hypothetical protein
MNETLCSIDWVKAAKVVQALATPAIAIWIAILSSRIQRQQVKTQQQQADTHHLQYRLALIERRMKVFEATLDFIAMVVREARVQTLEPCFKLLRETREHNLLFGPEIGEYINELYKKGVRLEIIFQMGQPHGIMRPEDIALNTEILEWFSGQFRVAEQKFLKYIDFREP